MEVTNIVATVKLSSPLDLEELEVKLEGAEMATKGAKWLKIRLKPEDYYIAFYGSGSFLITGVKSIAKVEEVAKRVIALLNSAGIGAKKEGVNIHNLVCMETIEMKWPLELLVLNLDLAKSTYEPEQFPGLLYSDWGASFILFSSGKVIVTGIKSEEDAMKVFKNFEKLIKEAC